VKPEEMDRLIEAHLEAETAGDSAASVSMYTEDVEHDVVGTPTVRCTARRRHKASTISS
jgi:ketosteroid isomerase-like protein